MPERAGQDDAGEVMVERPRDEGGPEYIEFRGQTWRVTYDQWCATGEEGEGVWHLDLEGPYEPLTEE